MTVGVKVKVPGFDGSFNCAVEFNEFEKFVAVLRELKNSLGDECENSWANMEGNIKFYFELHRLGGLSGSYKFSPNNFSLGPMLEGDFEADQTDIDTWLKQAEAVVAAAEG